MNGIMISSMIIYIIGVAIGYISFQSIRYILYILKGSTCSEQYMIRLIIFITISIIVLTICIYSISIIHIWIDSIFLYK